MTAPALAFDTDNGRYYRHPGNSKTVPSVTNIKNKKHINLTNFAAKRCANYAADRREVLATLDRSEVFSLVREAAWAREEWGPGAIGDVVHRWIDGYVKTHVTPDKGDAAEWDAAPITARRMFQRFLDFEARYHPEYTLSEFTVWSDTHDYAGTGDLGLKIGGRHVLVDTKTGESIYPDVAMQLAALGGADYILNEDGTQADLPGFEAYGILHLRPMSASLVPVFHIEDWLKAFLGLRELFRVEVEMAETTLGYAPKIKA